jgi:ubiquitin carboxyl-terminal hydrolase 4/11/15
MLEEQATLGTSQTFTDLLKEQQPAELAEFEGLAAAKQDEGSLWHVVSQVWLTNWKHFLLERTETSPGPVTNESILERLSEDAYYLDPRPNKNYTNVALKPELMEGRDYEVVPNEAYRFLVSRYDADDTQIKRWSTALDEEGSLTQVEVYLKQITVLVHPGPSGKSSSLKRVQMLRQEYIESLIEKVCICSGIDPSQKCRAWKLEAPCELEAVMRLSRHSVIPRSKLMKNPKQELEDAEIAEDDVVLIEFAQRDGQWSFMSDALESCVRCRKVGELLVCSGCKTVKYCSSACQSAHYSLHKELCKKLSRVKNKTSGLTGLQNLGNTCFMNSALQCLSHTAELTSYFIEGRHSADINTRNPIGTGGALANAYAELVSDLWLSNKDSISPWRFKKTLGKFAPQFSGYLQHDSQELLSYVLDGLHEDLNLVKSKPYLPDTDPDLSKSDNVLSEESWERHQRRNRSVIVDLMHGQCKSKLVCPDCGRVSVTFDPFLSYSLQIPNKETAKLDAYFISLERNRLPLKLTAELTMSSSLGSLRELLTPVVACDFLWVSMYKNKIQQFHPDSTEIAELRFSQLFAFECPADMAGYLMVPLIVTRKAEKGLLYTSQKSEAAFTQLLFLRPEFTLRQVYLKVLQLFKSSVPQLDSADLTEASIEKIIQSKLCSVKIVNCAEMKLGRYSYTKLPCDFCREATCTNCPLPLSDSPLQELISLVKNTKSRFSLEIEWASTVKELKQLNYFDEHDAVLRPPSLAKRGSLTLRDCLELTSRPEKLDRENAWYCSHCKRQVEATKTYQLFRLPQILVLHLKRFRSRGHWSEKITSLVEFPVKGLDLSEFVLGEGRAVYDLYAVSNHFGGLGGGHYTAYVSTAEGEWYEMNDSSVSRTDRVVSPAAYVLFYRRRG